MHQTAEQAVPQQLQADRQCLGDPPALLRKPMPRLAVLAVLLQEAVELLRPPGQAVAVRMHQRMLAERKHQCF